MQTPSHSTTTTALAAPNLAFTKRSRFKLHYLTLRVELEEMQGRREQISLSDMLFSKWMKVEDQ